MIKYSSVLNILFIVQFLIFFFPNLALCDEKQNNKWSYTLENGIEKTERSYLFVSEPNSKNIRKIWVNSKCQRTYASEVVYGNCLHNVEIEPTNRMFTLRAGEDVVIIMSSPLILATIEYGCCASPDTVRFYTELGEYLGEMEDYNSSQRTYVRNRILRYYCTNNIARDGDKTYLLLPHANSMEAIVFDKSGNRNNIPVIISIQDIGECEEWHIKDFGKFADRPGISLILEGFMCDENDQIFTCTETAKGLSCNKFIEKKEQ